MPENQEKEIVEVKSGVPSEMIQMAISKGADLDKLEKLLTSQERWERNEARKAYHKAMAEFKANPPEIDKDKTVKYKDVKYNHASLYNVTKKISSELSKYGLSASWTTKQNGAIAVTCKITHMKGHSEETTLSAPADTSGSKNTIQAIGSTISYLQRYTILSLAGLATYDQDDDGMAMPMECVDEKQLSQILDFINEKNVDIERFCKAFGISKVEELPKTRFQEAIFALERKKKS